MSFFQGLFAPHNSCINVERCKRFINWMKKRLLRNKLKKRATKRNSDTTTLTQRFSESGLNNGNTDTEAMVPSASCDSIKTVHVESVRSPVHCTEHSLSANTSTPEQSSHSESQILSVEKFSAQSSYIGPFFPSKLDAIPILLTRFTVEESFISPLFPSLVYIPEDEGSNDKSFPDVLPQMPETVAAT